MSAQNEQSAGGLVYRRTGRGLELLLIKDHAGKWTLAKGHVEDGEESAAAALREVGEETGLTDLTIGPQVGEVDYWFKDKWRKGGSLIHKTVQYYLLEAPAEAEPAPPQDWSKGTEPITDARWMTPDEALKASGYKDNTKMLEKAVEVLKLEQKRLLE